MQEAAKTRLPGLVLADDATGALEAASLLASRGTPVQLALGSDPPATIDHNAVLVADLETRHLPPAQAAALITRWLSLFDAPLYKKTDSTLRGNIGAELEAIHLSLPHLPLLYLPAYPKLKRTVRDATLFVDGVPVHQTALGRDPRLPVTTSYIPDLFTLPVHRISFSCQLEKSGISLCDAETEAHLDALFAAMADPAILAGPSASISRWADLVGLPQSIPLPLPQVQNWLIVCGSAHPNSRQQAAQARHLPVLATPDQPGEPAQLTSRLIRETLHHLQTHATGGIIIMGGETAWALWRALGIRTLEVLPEVLPGIAASRAAGLVFVTKAGAFADIDVVQQIIKKFT